MIDTLTKLKQRKHTLHFGDIFLTDLRHTGKKKLELMGFKGHFRFGTYQLQP
jgi:hypothetical protein